jgi:hypothetical protein
VKADVFWLNPTHVVWFSVWYHWYLLQQSEQTVHTMGNRKSRGSAEDSASASSSGSDYAAAHPPASLSGIKASPPKSDSGNSESSGPAIPPRTVPVPMWNRVPSGDKGRTSDAADEADSGDSNVLSLLGELKRDESLRKIAISDKVVVTEVKVKKRKAKQVNQYLIGKTIGKGSFGKVKLVVDQNTKEQLAMKIMSKSLLKRKKVFIRGRMSNQLENIKQELKIMYMMHHPNIISLIEIIEDKNVDKLFLGKCPK